MRLALATVLLALFCGGVLLGQDGAKLVSKTDLPNPQEPFDSYCPSVVQSRPGVLEMTWYGGPTSGQANLEADTKMSIWFSRWEEESWTPAVEIATAQQKCWNPVLCHLAQGHLMLFYKVGLNPRCWQGFFKYSLNGGRVWSTETMLPAGIIGPTRNHPVMNDRAILQCGSSWEAGEPGEAYASTAVWVEQTPDLGTTWCKVGPITKPGNDAFGLLQPCLYYDAHGSLRMLARDRAARAGKIGWLWTATSSDGGDTWSKPEQTEVPNADLPVDVYRLTDGRYVLAYNPVHEGRSPLALALSKDGITWMPWLILEEGPGDFTYPSLQQIGNQLHILYAATNPGPGARRLRHAVIALETPEDNRYK